MREDSIDKFVAGSGDLYRRLVEQVPVVTYVRQLGEPNRMVYVSPQIETFLGYRAVDLIGDSERWSNIVHPEDRERVLEEVTRAGEAGEPLNTEYRILTGNGRCVRVKDAATVARDEEGYPRFLQGAIFDVAECKASEEEMIKTGERFRSAFENASTGAALLDLDNRYLRVNRAFCGMLGYPEEELLSKKSFEITHPEDLDASRRRTERLFSGEIEMMSLEKRYLRKDGQVVWAISDVSLMRDLEGKPDYFIAHYQDITESKLAEQELRRVEARNRVMLDASPDLMFLVNRAGEFLDFEAQDDELYVPPEKIVGSRLCDVMPAEMADTALNYIGRALDSSEIQVFEYRLPAPEGLRDFEARLVVSGTDEVLAVVRDITERKWAEEAQARQVLQAEFRTDVSTAFTGHDSLQGALQHCTEAMVRHLDAAFARIWILNEEENVLELQASAGMYTHIDGGHSRVPVGKLKIGLIAQELEPHLTNNVAEDPHIDDKEWARREGIVSFAGYPLIVEGQPVGVMALFARETLSEDTLEALASIMSVVAQSIRRKRAEEALHASEANLVMGQRLAHLGSYEVGPLNDGTPWIEHEMRWSDKMYRILGFAPREFVPTFESFIKAIHPDDLERVTSITQGSMSRREPSLSLEHRITRPDGEVRTVQAQVETVFDKRNGMPFRQSGTLLDITEQKRAEQRIHESEERYRNLVERIPAVVYIDRADVPDVASYTSPQIKALVGYTSEEWLGGRLWKKLIHHDDRGWVLEVDGRARAAEEPFGEEYRLIARDGRVVWVRDQSTLLRDEAGRPLLWQGVLLDITERKKSEAALKESEESHRRQARELSLLHQVRTALAQELDLPVVFRAVVEAIADTYGYAQVSAYLLDDEELMLQHQVGYEHVIERVHISEGVMGRVARSGQSVLLEDVRDDPAFLGAIEGLVSEVCVPLFDEGGVVGVLNVESTDDVELTEDDLRLMNALGEHVEIAIGRAQLYTQVRESEERFRSLVQNASDAISILAADSTIIYDSPAIERTLGYKSVERIGTKAFDYVHPEDLAFAERTFSEVLNNPGVGLPIEYRLRHKDGSWRYFEAIRTNLLDDPAVGGVVLNYRDVTERRRAEQRLEESEQRYKSLYAHNPDAVYSFDLEGNFVSANLACETLTDYTAEEHMGRPFAPLVVPEDLERTLWHFEKAAKGEPQNYEIAINHKRGHRVELNVTNLPIVVAGEIVGVYGIAKDITERRRTEQAHARLAAIVQSSEDAIISRMRDGIITSWNKGAEKLYGYTAEEVIGRSGSFLYPPEHPQEMSEILEKIQRGESLDHHETVRMAKSGRRVCVSLSVSPIRDASGNAIGDSGIARDITEQKQAEEALSESEERYRAVIEQSAEAIWLFDPDTKRVLESNTSFQELLGYTAEELREMTNYDFVAHSREDIDALVQFKVLGGKSWPRERKYRRKDGTLLDVEVGGAVISYQSKRVVCSVARDLTERKALEERLTYQAFHDPLTELPNRALFLDRLQHALASAGRQISSIAVLYVDLDNFKIINDTLGHEAGDRVLVEAGRRLRSCLRPADTVARLGGDEFIVLLENNAGVREAIWISERILEEFRGPLLLKKQETLITPSIGIFLAGPDSRPEEILRNADLAMYRAKEKGKAQYEVFDLAIHDRTLERLKLEADLKQGVERGELRVYYQPKVRLDTGKIIGMEALARWDRPGLGIVLPEEFIPVAEETGLIIPLGHSILKEACRQGREWQEQYPEDPPLKVCVNLSARQFQRHNLVKEVAGVLKETRLDPRSLILEITESVIMDEAESSIAILEELKDLGVQLAIDDFGTGYSSLSYLNRFPVDFLKIDRSFIEGLPEGLEDTAVVSSIIALAHTLGMQVTAEGVETDQQLSQLREIDCDLAQGLCFAGPLVCEAASTLLADDLRW